MSAAFSRPAPAPPPTPLPAAGLLPEALSPLLPSAPSPERPEPEALLRQHRPVIYAFLRRKGFPAEEADDLTQETLIHAYLHLEGFRGASMTAWLYRIAANVAVDSLRKRKFSTQPLDAASAVPGGEEEPWRRLDREQWRRRLEAVISLLPACHQRILHLRYFEDRSLAEIAEAMSCSPMAAKLRVFRAVTALRKRWRAEGASGEWSAS
jgi:RNA polymerase sigma-70 factor (ECF subfamily)